MPSAGAIGQAALVHASRMAAAPRFALAERRSVGETGAIGWRGDRQVKWALGVVLAAILSLVGAGAAQAQTFTVSNLGDSGGENDGSLRGELMAANNTPGADTIVFASGLSGTITISGTGLVIREAVDIEGPGPAQLTVAQTTAERRVFQVKLEHPEGVKIAGLHLTGGSNSDGGGDVENDDGGSSYASLTIENCLVTGGKADDYGGGIAAYGGPFTMRGTVVEGNEASGGAGLFVGGDGVPFTIERSTIAGNTTEGGGGGMIVETQSGGHGEILDSTFSGNSAEEGGGIDVSASSGTKVRIANSTFSGNTTEEAGAGIRISAGELTTTIEDSTIAGNQAGASVVKGSGLVNDSGSARQTLVDSIVAENQGPSPDLGGSWVSSFSLIASGPAAKSSEAVPGSDILGVEPQLAPLADNGGPTRTMALSPTSPAVNKGGGALTGDQRGEARPVAYPGVANSSAAGANGADIGAFELQAPPPVAAPARLTQVRVRCPKSAKRGGCRFKLQVVSAKPKRVKGKLRKPTPESAIVKVKLKAGHSKLVTMKPKPKFAARIEAAKKLLVREVETAKGKTRTAYRRLTVADRFFSP